MAREGVVTVTEASGATDVLRAARAAYDRLPAYEKSLMAEALHQSYRSVGKMERTGSHKQRQVLRFQQAIEECLKRLT